MVNKEKKIKSKAGYLSALLFIIICMILVSCSINMDESLKISYKERTVLFYIIADNNLKNEANNLFKELSKFKNEDFYRNNNIVIYYDVNDGASLYEFNTDGVKFVKHYGDLNSLSTHNMKQILEDVDFLYPSNESGLIFWSHGTGWLPTGGRKRSFGDDNGEAMDISCLSESLFKKYDYIIFDACYMGCVEVFSEIYPYSKYILSSPGIVPPSGIMDKESLSYILNNDCLEKRLIDVCKNYIKKNSSNSKISVSLIRTDHIDEVINLCHNIQIDKENIEEENFYLYEFRSNKVFYDMGSLFQISSCEEECFNNFIVYHSNTDGLIGNLDITVFIPSICNMGYHDLYKITKWNMKTEWLKKFGF